MENKFKNFKAFSLKTTEEKNYFKYPHLDTFQCNFRIQRQNSKHGEKRADAVQRKKNQTDVRFFNNTGCKWMSSKN